MTDMQPGQLIVPHGNSEEPKPPMNGVPEPERPTEVPEQPAPPAPTAPPEPSAMAAATPVPQLVSPAASVPASFPAQEDQPDPWRSAALPSDEPDMSDIEWTASEAIDHSKNASWYGVLAIAGLAIAALVYFLTKDKISTGIVVLVTIGLGVFAARKPRIMDYHLSTYRVQIGPKEYGLHDFKAFSVAEEGSSVSVVLLPLKRFMPPLTIYIAPDLEDRVVDFLSVLLPFEQHRVDLLESFMRRIRL